MRRLARKQKLVNMGGRMEPEIVTRFSALARAKGLSFISALRREMIRAISQGEIYGIQEARLPDEIEPYAPTDGGDDVSNDLAKIEVEQEERVALEQSPLPTPRGAERLVLKSTPQASEDPLSKNQTPSDKPRNGRKKLQPSVAQ